MNSIQSFILTGAAVLVAIAIHEVGHAYMAYFLGDNTAQARGRLTLNPFSHIDPIGFMALLFFGFGWAKPVPINSRNFKNYKRDSILVALAGPMANILFSTVLYIVATFLLQLSSPLAYAAVRFLSITASISVGLAVFNLLPIPPLDGSHIFYPLFPMKMKQFMYEKQQMIQFIMIIGLMIGIFSVPLTLLKSIVTDGILVVVDLVTGLFI